MELIKPNINFDFVGKIKWALTFSLSLFALSVLSLLLKGGPRYGLDFIGGTVVQVKFANQVDIGEVRAAVDNLTIEGISVQEFGEKDANEYLISMKTTSEELEGISDKIRAVLEQKFGAKSLEIRRVEMVGPKVGKDLRQKGMLAVIFSLIGMLIYIWYRFEFRFGLGAIFCLIHDVVITLGVFSILNKPVDLIIVAALLTIVGYDINDTIIVCDRIRENMKKMTQKSLREVINTSINQTLSRTIITSGTVVIVLIALFFFGGEVLHDFSFCLLIGVFFGTFSSIYVATPLVIYWEKFFPKKKRR